MLASLIRQVPLCHCKALVDYFEDTAEVVPMLMHMNALDSFWRMCPLLSIDSGYGLSAFLYELAELYAALELTKGVNEKSVLELNIGVGGEWGPEFGDWESAVSMAKDMRRFNSRNGGGRPILCLKIAAWQNRLTEPRVKEYLRQLNAMAVNFTLVFAIPFVETQTLNSVANALGDVFDIRTLAVPPTGTPKLLEYAKNELAKRSFTLDDNVNEVLEQWVLDEKRDDSFFGYKTMEKLVNRIIYDKALGNCRSGRLDRVIAAADLQGYGVAAGPDGDPWAELNGLVGLGEVKRRVEEVVAQIKAQRKLAGKGRKVSRPAIHMLFTGNPGTGKTTVARIVARILKREGILRKGHLLEVRGRDLCGEYIGQTAPKTSALCRDAYGSVLFIDEAYSLFRGDGNDRDYGREALDTLVAEMENHRDDLCVILAGYTDDMKAMLAGNEGLASRIPFTVEFPDYSRDEMSQIFFTMAKDGFDCEPNLEQAVKEYFNAIPDEALKQKGFSNARFVRNLYERTWGKAAYRSRMDDDDIKLLVSDLSGATEEREFKQLVEKAPRRAIGFGN